MFKTADQHSGLYALMVSMAGGAFLINQVLMEQKLCFISRAIHSLQRIFADL
jgi:hypothetical protein